MGDLDELVDLADASEARFRRPESGPGAASQPQILFDAVQLPLVAFTTLACLSLRGPQSFPLSEAGLRVGAALMAAFPKFEAVGRLLQWSLRVRAVTSEAIVLLEQSDLALVREAKSGRSVAITERGRNLIAKARRDDGEIGRLIESLRRAARRTRTEEFRLL